MLRRAMLPTALLGVATLAAGLVGTSSAIAEREHQQQELSQAAALVAASFDSYFERARSLDLLLAQNPVVTSTGDSDAGLARLNQALGYMEVLYPNAIGEACLIDETGRELARVTHGVAAPRADLSPDESTNEFFAATLRLKRGQVLQAAPYVSVDTGTWVISNSTWVPRADGSRVVVHFEVSLASFVKNNTAFSEPSRHLSVVDRGTGRVLLESGTALTAPGSKEHFPVTSWSAALIGTPSLPVALSVGGRRASVQPIAQRVGNVNSWYVVEWATKSQGLLPVQAGITAIIVGILLIALAVMLLRRQQRALRAAARLDHLTGLSNRKALEEALEEALQASEDGRSDGRAAVLVLDLDGFKQINDTLGHDKGDLVLKEIARRLHANVFEYDVAARLGGDEFAVVLRRLREADDVGSVAQRLREALVQPIDIGGTRRFVGASIGAAVWPEHGATSVELLRAADAAMYQAKRGKEGVRVYTAGTHAGDEALGLAAELQQAIQAEELTMAFQPLVSLSTMKIVGVESLARWERPGKEAVSPAEFIALAEETGLIRPLTQLTLRLALDEAKAWAAGGVSVPVSVNLSALVVVDPLLPAEIAALLAECGLDACSLVLEVTETALIGDVNAAVGNLRRLRSMGVRIELDDFGSGYASFKALHELPLDAVKIDRDLISGQPRGESRLLSATIEIAHRLGMDVVAEGIEDASALDHVRQLGCDRAQGYLLGRPSTPDAIRIRLGVAPAHVVA